MNKLFFCIVCCRSCRPRPGFQVSSSGGFYECTLTLPANAPIGTIVGPSCRNSHLAKQLVCLEACKKLHQMGALNDHLLPSVEEPPVISLETKGKDSESGPGVCLLSF